MIFRRATADDVAAIVALLAEDPLGLSDETLDPAVRHHYDEAFADIDRDPNQLLAVGEHDGVVVATMQLSFIPNLTMRGTRRAQIEGVRVGPSMRGRGVGRQFLDWAVERACERGRGLVQLTTKVQRVDAQRFYSDYGFVASHIGMKLPL